MKEFSSQDTLISKAEVKKLFKELGLLWTWCCDRMIPYGRQTIDDDDIAAVVAVLKSDYLTTGPAVATDVLRDEGGFEIEGPTE